LVSYVCATAAQIFLHSCSFAVEVAIVRPAARFCQGCQREFILIASTFRCPHTDTHYSLTTTHNSQHTTHSFGPIDFR